MTTKKKQTKKDEPVDLKKLVPEMLSDGRMNNEGDICGIPLLIPACGDRLVLVQPWTFTLYFEHRNHAFGQAIGVFKKTGRYFDDCYEPDPNGGHYGNGQLKSARVTLPAGLIIECDRVYIRTFNKGRLKEGDDYDSVTWKVVGKNGKTIQKLRFWAKLADCCSIQYALQPDSLYRDRVKLIKQVQEV